MPRDRPPSLRPDRPGRRVPVDPRAGDDRREGAGPPPAGVRRAAARADDAGDAQAAARARVEGDPSHGRRRADRAAVRGAAVRAHRRAAAGRSPRSSTTSPGRTRCTGCCRATSVPARPWWRSARCSTAVQGGHQGALMAPTEVLAEQHATGVRRMLEGVTVPDPGNLFGDRPLRVELLTNRVTGGERRDVLAGLADGTVDIAIGTHALIQEGVRVPQPRRGRDRRAAPLRRRAACRAALEGRRRRRARRAGDDGDADPADRGDDGVRRPRRERARRAAARAHADRHPVGRRPADGAGRVGDGPRRGGRRPPGVRRVPADRGEREARGGQRAGDVRPPGGRRAEGPAARSAARAAAVGGEGGGDGHASARASSTCSWRPP